MEARQMTDPARLNLSRHSRRAVALMDACSKEGQLILDPFVGSGTTGAVSVAHRRQFLGIDVNPEYCELSRQRIKDAAPNEAAAEE